MTDPLPLPLGDNAAYALPLAEGGVLLVDAGPDIPGAEGETGPEDVRTGRGGRPSRCWRRAGSRPATCGRC